MTLRAHVVRRQRIDFRDAGHGGDKRRTDGSTGADEIAAVIGMFHELVRDVIQDAVAVLDNRRQFLMKTIFHDFR